MNSAVGIAKRKKGSKLDYRYDTEDGNRHGRINCWTTAIITYKRRGSLAGSAIPPSTFVTERQERREERLLPRPVIKDVVHHISVLTPILSNVQAARRCSASNHRQVNSHVVQ